MENTPTAGHGSMFLSIGSAVLAFVNHLIHNVTKDNISLGISWCAGAVAIVAGLYSLHTNRKTNRLHDAQLREMDVKEREEYLKRRRKSGSRY